MQIVEPLSASGASEDSIVDFEAELAVRLPDDYRRFLAETNGGRPEPSGFVFQTTNGPSDSLVDWFLTLYAAEELYTLREYRAMYGDRIPPMMLPIACDPFGNLVLLDVGAKSIGAVCFWDHEKESMDEATWDNISVVAQSFTDFLNALE